MQSKNLELIISQLEDLTLSLFPEILKIYEDKDFKTRHKKDGSPVTKADMLGHKLILKFLNKHYPDIPIVSEESFTQKGYKPVKEFWLVDPIDGTKEFVNRSGEFTTNIALIQNGHPVLGVVGAPAINKIWSGISAQTPKTTKLKAAQRIPKTKTPQKGINIFFISKTEYRAMPMINGAKKKNENESKSVARQIHRDASRSFFLMFVLFFKLSIRRNEKSMKRLEINVEVCSKT